MIKQELAHIAKVMYDLQEYCRFSDECQRCFMAEFWRCFTVDVSCIPQFWGITKADIERLEREDNE
jgi:hypothetical protein